MWESVMYFCLEKRQTKQVLLEIHSRLHSYIDIRSRSNHVMPMLVIYNEKNLPFSHPHLFYVLPVYSSLSASFVLWGLIDNLNSSSFLITLHYWWSMKRSTSVSDGGPTWYCCTQVCITYYIYVRVLFTNTAARNVLDFYIPAKYSRFVAWQRHIMEKAWLMAPHGMALEHEMRWIVVFHIDLVTRSQSTKAHDTYISLRLASVHIWRGSGTSNNNNVSDWLT